MSSSHAENIQKIIGENGLLSRCLKGFEPRIQQQKMMQDILEAYDHNSIALIEAGTGTGKSLAYLIPALLWAVNKKERTVISTHTITLQEQLIEKDIPLVRKALNLDVQAVLVKGMRNYICLRKLEEARFDMLCAPEEEAVQYRKLEAWAQTTRDGSRSSLSFVPSGHLWEQVCAENDTCNNSECPYYQNCHFFKARRQANDAQVLVVNHHLLFADLVFRADSDNYKDPAVLPPYTKIVIDEAHHIEDIATEYFASRVHRLEILRTLSRLAAEKGTKSHGKLFALKEKIYEIYTGKTLPTELSPLMARLNIDLPGIRRDLLQQVADAFDAFGNFVQSIQTSNNGMQEEQNKLRLLPHHRTHPIWPKEITPLTEELGKTIKRYLASLEALEKDIKSFDDPRLIEATKGIRFEISALGARLLSANEVLENFVSKENPPSKVRWIEIQQLKALVNIHLVDAQLDISRSLVDFLSANMTP